MDGCFSFKRTVESPIYKKKPYSFIGTSSINNALEDFEASQWASCVLGVRSSLPAAWDSSPKKNK